MQYALNNGYTDINVARDVTIPKGLKKTKRNGATRQEIEIIKNRIVSLYKEDISKDDKKIRNMFCASVNKEEEDVFLEKHVNFECGYVKEKSNIMNLLFEFGIFVLKPALVLVSIGSPFNPFS
mgnify:CR=1 FL=1